MQEGNSVMTQAKKAVFFVIVAALVLLPLTGCGGGSNDLPGVAGSTEGNQNNTPSTDNTGGQADNTGGDTGSPTDGSPAGGGTEDGGASNQNGTPIIPPGITIGQRRDLLMTADPRGPGMVLYDAAEPAYAAFAFGGILPESEVQKDSPDEPVAEARSESQADLLKLYVGNVFRAHGTLQNAMVVSQKNIQTPAGIVAYRVIKLNLAGTRTVAAVRNEVVRDLLSRLRDGNASKADLPTNIATANGGEFIATVASFTLHSGGTFDGWTLTWISFYRAGDQAAVKATDLVRLSKGVALYYGQ